MMLFGVCACVVAIGGVNSGLVCGCVNDVWLRLVDVHVCGCE